MMEINSIFSYLVHPSKNEEDQPIIGGTSIPLEGNLFSMLSIAFDKAEDECNIDIAFISSDAKTQYNSRRSELIQLMQNGTVENGRAIAEHLQSVTTNRSGLGLLFIVLGNDGNTKRLYMSRFPADFGIIAQEDSATLRVELIEQVFMKNKNTYKAVVFDGESYDSDFWLGKAIDKQINNNAITISGYWIREFLLANFRTTSAQGTKRLATAIKLTIDQTEDLEIKEELAAAALLARSLNGQIISLENFGERFALTNKTIEALTTTLSNPNLRFDQFRFSSSEFSKHIKYHSLQISNGATLIAPSGKFDECFEKERIADQNNEYVFTTRGAIVNERLSTNKGIK